MFIVWAKVLQFKLVYKQFGFQSRFNNSLKMERAIILWDLMPWMSYSGGHLGFEIFHLENLSFCKYLFSYFVEVNDKLRHLGFLHNREQAFIHFRIGSYMYVKQCPIMLLNGSAFFREEVLFHFPTDDVTVIVTVLISLRSCLQRWFVHVHVLISIQSWSHHMFIVWA